MSITKVPERISMSCLASGRTFTARMRCLIFSPLGLFTSLYLFARGLIVLFARPLFSDRLQEVAQKPANIVFEEPWVKKLKDVLFMWDYVKLKQIRMHGVMLLVYSKRNLVTEIRDIQTSHTRTGLGGLWGNKGAVTIRMNICGVSLCIVNAHLAAHIEHLDQRIKDYYSILDDQVFDDPQANRILSHE